jgi:hypothetical protein
MMHTLMLGHLLAVVTAALSRGHTNTLCSIATISLKSCLQPPVWPCAVKLQQLQACIASVWCIHDDRTTTIGSYRRVDKRSSKHTAVQYSDSLASKAVYNHQCNLVLSNYSNFKHAWHLYDACIYAGTTTSGSYRSAVMSWYKHTVQYSETSPQKLFTTTSVTLCCQTTATTSMHSVCMMYKLMIGQLLSVATAALSRGYTNTLCSIATILPQKLFTTTSVTLCCQTTATTSMHSVCMMHTSMLGHLLSVPTAALTRGHTNTLCSIAKFCPKSCLQPPVWPCAVKLQQLQACIATVWCIHWCWVNYYR